MLATSAYMIVFRILHIGASVAWGGSAFLFVVFLQPSAASLGPAAAPFMGELLGKRRLVNAILWIAAFTIAGGAFLYWHDWQASGSLGDWVGSRYGLVLTIGALAAAGAFLVGLLGTKPGVDRLLALGHQVAEAGGTPPPEVAREIAAVQVRLKALARTGLGLVAIAVLAMATARYW